MAEKPGLLYDPQEVAEDLTRFAKDLELMEEISTQLHQMFPHQYVAAYEGIVYTAPTFSELCRIFLENDLPFQFSPHTFLVPEEERRTIILKSG